MVLRGSLRQVSINGQSYDVPADAAITETPRSNIETVATSGVNMRKIVLSSGERMVTVIPTEEQKIVLYNLAQTQEEVPIYYIKSDSTTERCTGYIGIETGMTTDEGRIEIKLIPGTARWSTFTP